MLTEAGGKHYSGSKQFGPVVHLAIGAPCSNKFAVVGLSMIVAKQASFEPHLVRAEVVMLVYACLRMAWHRSNDDDQSRTDLGKAGPCGRAKAKRQGS